MVDTLDLMTERMVHASDEANIAMVSNRVWELRELNSEQWENRTLIRDILDGGVNGLRAILGSDFAGEDPRIPAPNLLVSAITTLGQKLGRVPTIKVDTPTDNDSDTARKAAAKKARIIANYDRAAKMDLQVPQLGRWLPGYGFCPVTMDMREDLNGDMYPHASIRDPYNAFPAQWGMDQQPPDIAFLHVMSPADLIRQFPEHETAIKAVAAGKGATSGISSGATHNTHIGWQNQKGAGIEVYEYVNDKGKWWVVPEAKILLSFTPNPLTRRAPFYVAKRFAFNKLIGQYDHVIGLMSTIARMNVLSVIAAEDAVFAETIVRGELRQGTEWNRGRDAVNFLEPNASAEKMQSHVPQEVFQQIDRLERQLRTTSQYSVQDDSQSPLSFATGRGLEELGQASSNEVREYFKVEEHMFVDLDSMRMEYDEAVSGRREKTMSGVLNGASFSEKYRPKVHIKGNYLNRRVYGAMASLDEPTKVVTMLNFLQADVVDVDTVRENVDGLEDLEKIANRVRQNQLEEVMMQFLLARAEQGDPATMEAIAAMMRDGEIKDVIEEVLVPQEQEQREQEQQPQVVEAGPPPDTQTVLARLMEGGAGVQTVGQV